MEKAIQRAYDEGFLGENIRGSGFSHDRDIYLRAGVYICGGNRYGLFFGR